MSESNQLSKVSVLWMHLDEAAFLISTAREKELKKNNLSSIQMKVLLTLNYLDRALTIQELCHWLARGHTSVSLLTDKMMGKGLVEKYPDLNNKNQTRVSITRQGKQTMRKLSPRKPIPDILSILSEEEADQLIFQLKRIISQAASVTSSKFPPDLDELSNMLIKGTD
jgi:DNA-binding MarR family transcriptional regulator